jgi:hypothetical protein
MAIIYKESRSPLKPIYSSSLAAVNALYKINCDLLKTTHLQSYKYGQQAIDNTKIPPRGGIFLFWSR